MTRRHRDQTFRKNDVVRAYKAAVAAGIPNPRIDIDKMGTISIISSTPEAGNAVNPWDEVLDGAPAEVR